MTQPRALLLGTGISVAPHRVDNHMLSRILDTNDEWVRERSGIETRYYVDPGVGSSDLGAAAAPGRRSKTPAWRPNEIDYVVCATMTPDHYFPGAGTLVQAKLGMDPRPVLDLRQQCAGFAYGLQVVDMLIRSGIAKKVLLVGCDVHSALMPHSKRAWDVLYGVDPGPLPEDEFAWNSQYRHLYVLFGDAAGAMVFAAHEKDDGRGILGHALYGDGNHKSILYVPGGGSAYRPWVDPEMIQRRRHRAGDGRQNGVQAGGHHDAQGDQGGAREVRLQPRKPRPAGDAPGQPEDQRSRPESARPARRAKSTTTSRNTATPPRRPCRWRSTKPSRKAKPRKEAWSPSPPWELASTMARC